VQELGWYADPGGKVGTFRWWDGGGWTRWLSRDATAPDPGPEPATDRDPPPATVPTLDWGAPTGDPVSADHLDHQEPVPARRPRVVAGSILAAALLAVIAGGAVVSLAQDRMPSGPAVAPPAAEAATVRYDPDLIRVELEEMTYSPPGEPFSCEATATERYPTFASRHSCFAFVHENYDATGNDWVSTVSLGVAADPLVSPGDLDATAEAVFDSIVKQDYVGDLFTLKKRDKEPLDIGAPGKTVLLSAEVHFSIKNLPSRYDRLVVVVSQLESGAYGVWYAARADDAPKSMRTTLTNSAATLTARK
jgi:hypothetical protein